MIVPAPLQVGHGPTLTNCPKPIERTCLTCPCPLHVEQVSNMRTGFAPVPVHVLHFLEMTNLNRLFQLLLQYLLMLGKSDLKIGASSGPARSALLLSPPKNVSKILPPPMPKKYLRNG